MSIAAKLTTTERVPFPVSTQASDRLTFAYIKKMQMICASFFTRLDLIRQNRTLEAISMKPSGIWYASVYALALKSLGITPVPLRDKSVSAKAMFTTLQEKLDFYCLMGRQAFWTRVPDEKATFGFKRSLLEMVRGVKPSEAFRSLIENLAFLDCNTVVQVALYLSLLEIFGEEKFNQVLSSRGPIFLGSNIHSGNFFKPIKTICRSLDCISSEVGFKLGQSFYLLNTQEYSTKHRFGNCDGYNLIYIGDNEKGQPLFIGFGLNPKGVTLREIAEILLQEFNDIPIASDLLLPEKYAKDYRLVINFKFQGKQHSVPFEDFPDYLSGKKRLDDFPPAAFQSLVTQYEQKRAINEKQITMPQLLSTSLFHPKETYQILDTAVIEEAFGPIPNSATDQKQDF